MPKSAEAVPDLLSHQIAVLPWRQDKYGSLSVLLVTSRTNRKWMMPKGWPIAGKTDPEAAQEEAFEEAGVEGLVSPFPIGSYHYIKLFADGSSRPAQAVIYAMEVTKERGNWKEKGQRERKWFTPAKAAKSVYERDLARFLNGLAAGRVIIRHPVL